MEPPPIPLILRDTLEQMFGQSAVFRYSFDEMEHTQPDTTDIVFKNTVFKDIASKDIASKDIASRDIAPRCRLQAEGA